jgi:hypothetical protein
VKRYSIILELPEGKSVEVCHCDANPEAIAAVVRAKHPLARVGIRDNQPPETMQKPGEPNKPKH